MGGIFRKCPFCGRNAILKTIEPDFGNGVFRRIFVCIAGHEFAEEVDLSGEKRWVKEILEELRKENEEVPKNLIT